MVKKLVKKPAEIQFVARTPFFEDVERPFPATNAVPEWFKGIKPYFPVTYTEINNEGFNVHVSETEKLTLVNDNFGMSSNATVKKCTPMLDSLTSGYIFPLWTGVFLRQTVNKEPVVSWLTKGGPRNWTPFSEHGNPSVNEIELPDGYSSKIFKYHNPWRIITPPGYSCLITSPFGYRNLPFRAIPAVIDTDRFNDDLIVPVWVKEGFEGIVEKGTPMLQVLPFKRVDWVSSYSSLPEGKADEQFDKGFLSVIKHHYLNSVWSKKSYK
jgi:hypothetical protein